MPHPGSPPAVVFSDEEITYLKSMGSDGVKMALQLAVIPAEARAQVKEIIAATRAAEVPVTKRGWTPERRAEQAAKMKARNAAVRAAKNHPPEAA